MTIQNGIGNLNRELFFLIRYYILFQKLLWPTARKSCSSKQENFWKFDGEGREFTKILITPEQLVQTLFLLM